MELETAARKHPLDQTRVQNLVSGRVYKFELEEPVEGTGKASIVLYRKEAWAKPGKNSQEYPILVVDCYADHSRDPDGGQTKDDRNDRAFQLYREVDRVLHQKDRFSRQWPVGDEDGLLVLGCFRGSEPNDVALKHGVAMVRVTYDVQVVHSG